MRITMVKKRLASGEPCEKCAQAEEMLRRRSLWERIDQVIWAVEGDESSPGARVAAKHGVELAPFFVLQDESGAETVVTSALRLVKQHLGSPAPRQAPSADSAVEADVAARTIDAHVEPLLLTGLERTSRSDGPDRAIVEVHQESVHQVDLELEALGHGCYLTRPQAGHP